MTEKLKELVAEAAQARRERRPEAKQVWMEVTALAHESGDRQTLIRGYSGIAQAERDAGNNGAAIEPQEEAVKLCREEGDALLLAHTVRHLGDVLRHEKRLEEAERCYDEAIAIYRREDAESLDFANALRPMALLQEDMGRDARELWREARDLYERAGVEAGVKEAERHLGR